MKPGKRDRLITLKKAGTSGGTDPFGNPIPGADVEVQAWAQYTPVSDRERLAAKEVSAEITGRFVVPYNTALADLSPTWWLTYDGRDYDISGVKEVGRNKDWEITANARAE